MDSPTGSQSLAEWLGAFLQQFPVWSAIILALAAIMLFGTGYLLLKERLSKQAKDIAEAGKLMADTLKQNTESLASAPQIVTSFATLVENTIKRELLGLDQMVSQEIGRQFQVKQRDLEANAEDARSLLREMREMRAQVSAIVSTASEHQQYISEQLTHMQSVLPDYEMYKNVADPETLVSRLSAASSWEDGKDLVAQVKRLVEDSGDAPEQIPSKFIEMAGDWCRERKQFPIALWFYRHSVERDPDRISSRIELNALLAEYVAKDRDESLQQLRTIALGAEHRGLFFGRIFNVFIETERYRDLAELCSELLAQEWVASHPRIRAVVLRNRALANYQLAFKRTTDEVWTDILKAIELTPDDENVLSTRAHWLVETDDFDAAEAIAVCERLIRLDPDDIKYYLLLSRVYALSGDAENARGILDIAEAKAFNPRDQLIVHLSAKQIHQLLRRNDPDFFRELLLDRSTEVPRA